jgi:bifunctional polynucleotide phosphatase/kinase
LPLVYLAALKTDQNRKPATGAFNYLKSKIFPGFEIDMTASFYCGDAAGRPKTATRPKDFSDSDIKFAANVGLRFMTPE